MKYNIFVMFEFRTLVHEYDTYYIYSIATSPEKSADRLWIMHLQIYRFRSEILYPTLQLLCIMFTMSATYVCSSGWFSTYVHMVLFYHSYFNYLHIVPSQVTDMTVSKAVHSNKPALRVTWTTPQSDVATSLCTRWNTKSGTTFWRVVSAAPSGSNTSTVLEALDIGTAYQVHIRAVSAIGSGMWSRVESETTYISELSGELEVYIIEVILNLI